MAIDTRVSIINRAQDTVNNTSTLLKTKMKEWINERYERIVRFSVPEMLIRSKDVSPTLSVRENSLGNDVLRILSIYDTTNNRTLQETTLERIEKEGLDTTNDTGDPLKYAFIGEHTVNVENGEAGTVTVVSSSDEDVSPLVLRVTGLSASVEVSQNIVIQGTTSNVGSQSWDANQKLKLAVGMSDGSLRDTVGKITVTRGSDTLAIIPPTQVASLYTWISYEPVPDADATQPTHRITYVKRPLRFYDDNDTPDFDCTDALVHGLIADALREDGADAEAEAAEARFNALVAELVRHFGRRPNLIEQFTPVGVNQVDVSARVGGVYTNPLRFY